MMTRISTTSSATAKILTDVRTGRAFKPATIICLFISVITYVRQIQEFGALGSGQIEHPRVQRFIHAHVFERDLDREVFDRPVNDNGFRVRNVAFALIVREVDVGFQTAVLTKHLLPGYL